MNSDQLLSTAEVAAVLRLKPRTVTAWARSGKLAPVRLSQRRLLFRASEIERLVDSADAARQCEPTGEEVCGSADILPHVGDGGACDA